MARDRQNAFFCLRLRAEGAEGSYESPGGGGGGDARAEVLGAEEADEQLERLRRVLGRERRVGALERGSERGERAVDALERPGRAVEHAQQPRQQRRHRNLQIFSRGRLEHRDDRGGAAVLPLDARLAHRGEERGQEHREAGAVSAAE